MSGLAMLWTSNPLFKNSTLILANSIKHMSEHPTKTISLKGVAEHMSVKM